MAREPERPMVSATSGTDPSLLEEDAEELYEEAPCGYLSTLPDGTIVKVNGTFLAWTGYRREELVGRRRWQDLLTPGGKIYHETHYAPMLRMQGAVREIALDLVGSGDRRLPVLVGARVKRHADGAPALIRTTVFDATERRMYERELLRAREEAERSEARARLLAQTLQKSFIPPALPEIPGLQVAAVYRPAGDGEEVGGDFYDVFETGRDDWAVALGDVAGKGAEAAAVTALARYTIRAAAMQASEPDVVLRQLNQALLRHETDRFCTVAYGRVRPSPEGVVLSVACGGHPLPILVSDGAAPAPVGKPGALLGVFEDPELNAAEVTLRSGDAVVFYTDGVIEGRAGARLFGDEELLRVLGSSGGEDAERIATRLVESVMAFQDGHAHDDIAVVVLRVP